MLQFALIEKKDIINIKVSKREIVLESYVKIFKEISIKDIQLIIVK